MTDKLSFEGKTPSAPNQERAGLQHFVEDICPFFYGRRIVYVDVGAFEGSVLKTLLDGGVSVREAHLFEPNPESFAQLEANCAHLPPSVSANLHNVAIGDAPGTVTMKAARTMTRVVDSQTDGKMAGTLSANTFEVECRTLDSLADQFANGRISVLKIDVEGFEEQALRGARTLLSEHRVDMIYIEAGADPKGTQQTHYRKIEDLLGDHGYKIFRIYEQKNQWMDDSPLLRRMNIAFMSPGFAESHPHKLTRKLFDLQEKLKARKTEHNAALKEARARHVAQLEQVRNTLSAKIAQSQAEKEEIARQAAAELDQHKQQSRKEAKSLQGKLSEARNEVTAHKLKLDALRSSTSWRLTAPLRAAGRIVKGKRQSRSKTRTLKATLSKPDDAPPAPAREKCRPAPYSRDARTHELGLWGGYASLSLAALEGLKAGENSVDRMDAAWALACWHTAEGNFVLGVESARVARENAPENRRLACALVESYCLVMGGYEALARALLEPFRIPHQGNPDLALALANAALNDASRLGLINDVLAANGLAPLAKADPLAPLSLENLTAATPAPEDAPVLVSVVVPAHDASRSLGLTLESLLSQSWHHLEILVVDDCSTDDTREIANAFSLRDERVRVLQTEQNCGAYGARNMGAAASRGELITVHDAGDWSHPQKIALQARNLVDNPLLMGNHSRWARVNPPLIFSGKFRRKDRILDWNPSSFMFRRTILDALGGWDPVRISADAEFIRRARLIHGNDAFAEVMAGAPLALGADDPASLTKRPETHGRTIFHGPRRAYREATDHWHAIAREGDLRMDVNRNGRPFPAPATVLPERPLPVTCDVLLIADFNREETQDRLDVWIADARAANKRIALFHWPHRDEALAAPLDIRFRNLIQDGSVGFVAPGESVRATQVVVGTPSVLSEVIDFFPNVAADEALLLDEPGGAEAGGWRETLCRLVDCNAGHPSHSGA